MIILNLLQITLNVKRKQTSELNVQLINNLNYSIYKLFKLRI